jgi:hypothetical protein
VNCDRPLWFRLKRERRADSGRSSSSPPPKFVVDGSGSEIPARECSAKTQFKTAKTENFRKRLLGTAAWLLCIRPSKFPKMIVHHIPIAAGRKRIDTAIKTRCLNPTAAHRVAFRCARSTRGGVASRAPAYYGVALSSLSRTTRSWGPLALFTRYSNSPLRSGSRLVMTHAPPSTAIDRSRKTVSPVWNLCVRHATHGTIP